MLARLTDRQIVTLYTRMACRVHQPVRRIARVKAEMRFRGLPVE